MIVAFNFISQGYLHLVARQGGVFIDSVMVGWFMSVMGSGGKALYHTKYGP